MGSFTPKKSVGFTLIEILLALGIAAILTMFVIPTFASVIDAANKRTISHSILGLLNFTREQAVNYGTPVIICPESSKRCVADWTKPLMVFVDKNKNTERDNNEKILAISDLIDGQESLSWKSFGSKSYIRFDEHGTTGFQSGRIYYCNNKISPDVRTQVIVYRTGRSRIARDSEYKDGC